MGFRRFTFREQIEILHLYFKKHPEGSLLKEIMCATGTTRPVLIQRIKQMRRLGMICSRLIGANNTRLYYAKRKKEI